MSMYGSLYLLARAPSSAPVNTGNAGGEKAVVSNPTTDQKIQVPAGTNTSTSKKADEGQGGILQSLGGLLPMILIFVVLYFVLFRGQRKEEKNRKKQIETMKKGDEVLLISGKFGTVVDIKDDRVVVKVDQANNIKETYLKTAIQRVLGDEDATKK